MGLDLHEAPRRGRLPCRFYHPLIIRGNLAFDIRHRCHCLRRYEVYHGKDKYRYGRCIHEQMGLQ